MEKNILQSIKLEISKNFKLVPYERIAFHRILGILKTENGMNVLLLELDKSRLVRESAISILKDFKNKEVTEAFLSLLKKDISNKEKLYILEHIGNFGSSENCDDLLSFIDENKDKEDSLIAVTRALDILRVIGAGSDKAFEYFSSMANNIEVEDDLRSLAVIGLSSFNEMSIYEKLLKEQNEIIVFSVYRALTIFCNNYTTKSIADRKEEEQIFTYTDRDEDRKILDVRVFLGKMSTHFDSYSNRTKTAFIDAMISCNHREFIIYTMKTLTSNDKKLIEMILYLILSNVNRLRDPDKLFRNLIALSVDTEKENQIIVEIFERFFTALVENRKNQLLSDRLYNYIVVTLETYFETYRREFMVTEVIEKDFPEEFQRIRQFILEKFNPGLKKDIVNYLKNDDNTIMFKILTKIAESIPFIDENNMEDLSILVEILYDSDIKVRANSASRIDSIKFEKRYLRDRIVRLCRIIGRLNISNAGSIMVKIYNYVQKYTDQDLLYSVSDSLSWLNYSYMLGELEVVLASGSIEEKEKSVKYLSLFSEQRSINIMFDFLKENADQDSMLIISILQALLNRDLYGNISANHILKKTIEANKNAEIRRLSILCVGKCGIDTDIDYLNDLFFSLSAGDPKESVVQSIGYIISLSSGFNKRVVINILQEYLKDPGIKVRIYACAILIDLGNKSAIRIIRDMMIIKNRNIQRDILSIVGRLKSVEFSYFIISLLKEEYAICDDIISILMLMPDEELIEIDHFIVNIFKKYETPDIDYSERSKAAITEETGVINNLKRINATMLFVEILGFNDIFGILNLTDITILLSIINKSIISDIMNNDGVISSLNDGNVISYFSDPVKAANSSIEILKNIDEINKTRPPDKKININLHMITDEIEYIMGEILRYSDYKIDIMRSAYLSYRVIIDEATMKIFENLFHCELFSEVIFKETGLKMDLFELISPINFIEISKNIINKLKDIDSERKKLQEQIDQEVKKQKKDKRSPTAVAYVQAVDELSRILKFELNEINKYVQKSSTDRKFMANVDTMLANVYKRFIVETSKIIIE